MTGWAVWIPGAYVVGSIPFGFMLGRLVRGVDIREHGSRNIGATNVGRVLGRPLGMLCFALDVGKGAVPTLVSGFAQGVIGRAPADLATGQMLLWMTVALAAVLGHMFSLFLAFRGGKGVATGFGAMIAMWPLLTLPALLALVVWYAIVRITRYISLASIIAALSLPLAYLLSVVPNTGDGAVGSILHASPPLVVTTLLALLVVYRHRANIGRLRRGEEPRVGGATRRGDVLDGGPSDR
jgi:glycerol-3-phosphate acyltransferase PlsY